MYDFSNDSLNRCFIISVYEYGRVCVCLTQAHVLNIWIVWVASHTCRRMAIKYSAVGEPRSPPCVRVSALCGRAVCLYVCVTLPMPGIRYGINFRAAE